MAWEKLLPTFNFSFRDFSFHAVQTVQTVSLCPHLPCSPLLSMLALFFLFSLSSKPVSCDVIIIIASTSPHPHTGDILSVPPQHCNYHTNPMAATTTTTSPFAGSQAPTELALSHTRCGHTQATLLPSPSLCLVVTSQNRSIHFSLFYPCLTFSMRLMVTHRLDSCDHLLYRLVTQYVLVSLLLS